MRKHANTAIDFIKNHKIISILGVLILVFVLYKIFFSAGETINKISVKRGDVIQKVIVNGNTKPVDSVDLGFQVNGTVSRVYVDVGTRVSLGQPLVALDSSELYAQSMKAEANVASEKARLAELKNGARPEEIAVSETEVENAKINLSDAQRNLRDKVVDVIGKIDQLFSNPNSSSPQINLTLSDSQLKSDINNGRSIVGGLINTWNLANGENNLTAINTFIDNVSKAVNTQSATPSLSQTTIDGYKADVSSAKSTIITYRDALTSAKSSLVLAEKNLSLKKSGNSPEAIASQEAKVLQTEAELRNINAQLAKTTIKSPQSGVVTKQDAKVGEITTPGKNVVTIISDNNLEIESNVSEVSIGKVSLDNPVDIVFDAFPGQVFKGKVTYIEPGETIVDGVVNYKVTVAFLEKYPEIKSGLTSKLDIITGIKSDVLNIPAYTVKTRDGKKFVDKIIDEKNTQEVEVTVGLLGQDGSIEILSGVNEGEVIKF